MPIFRKKDLAKGKERFVEEHQGTFDQAKANQQARRTGEPPTDLFDKLTSEPKKREEPKDIDIPWLPWVNEGKKKK